MTIKLRIRLLMVGSLWIEIHPVEAPAIDQSFRAGFTPPALT